MSGLANVINLWGPLAQGLGMGADISRARRLDEERRLAMQQQQAMAEREMMMREADAQRRGQAWDQSQRERAAFRQAVPNVWESIAPGLALPPGLDQMAPDDAVGIAGTMSGARDRREDRQLRMRLGEQNQRREFERRKQQQEGIAAIAEQRAQRIEQRMEQALKSMGVPPGSPYEQTLREHFQRQADAERDKAAMARLNMDLSAAQLLGGAGGAMPNTYIPGADPRQDTLIQQRTRSMAAGDPSVRAAKARMDAAQRALDRLYGDTFASEADIQKAAERAAQAETDYTDAFNAAMGRFGQSSGNAGQLPGGAATEPRETPGQPGVSSPAPAMKPKATGSAGPAPTGAGGKPIGLVAENDEDFDQGAAALGKFQLRGPDGKVRAVDAATLKALTAQADARLAVELGSRADAIVPEERRAMQLRILTQILAEQEAQAAEQQKLKLNRPRHTGLPMG